VSADADNTRLRELLARMDLPAGRLEPIDKKWLLRNIGIKNWKHPDLAEAIKLLKAL
jgi:hypothetical protein